MAYTVNIKKVEGKMKIAILCLMMTTILHAADRTSLDQHGWLMVKCYDEGKKSSFEFSVSSDEVNNVRQVTVASFTGELLDAVKSDSKYGPKPLVGFATVTGNNLSFLLRYESECLNDTYFDAKMELTENGYESELTVKGDEGTYYSQHKILQCWVGNNGTAYLTTRKYR